MSPRRRRLDRGYLIGRFSPTNGVTIDSPIDVHNVEPDPAVATAPRNTDGVMFADGVRLVRRSCHIQTRLTHIEALESSRPRSWLIGIRPTFEPAHRCSSGDVVFRAFRIIDAVFTERNLHLPGIIAFGNEVLVCLVLASGVLCYHNAARKQGEDCPKNGSLVMHLLEDVGGYKVGG